MCSVSDVKIGPYCAPSILITFINMVLFKENTAPQGCDAYMYGGQVCESVIVPVNAKIIMAVVPQKQWCVALRNMGDMDGVNLPPFVV